MSVSTSDAVAIAALNNASNYLNRYLSIVIYGFGMIGNLLNILILIQSSYRSNPCSVLLLATTIASLIALISGLTTRMLSGWITDPVNTIGWFCKLRAIIVFVSRSAITWFMVLATVDRWLSSSRNAHNRQKSSLKNAKQGMLVVLVVSFALYAQTLYCYESYIPDYPLKCSGKTEACRMVTDLSYSILSIIVPLTLMIIFGLKTIINVHQTSHVVAPTTSITHIGSQTGKSSGTLKKNDRSLTRMLLLQVFILATLLLPQGILKTYATFTSKLVKSSLQTAIENFLLNFAILLTNIASGITFYIYTLSGTVFRRTLKQIMITAKQKIIG